MTKEDDMTDSPKSTRRYILAALAWVPLAMVAGTPARAGFSTMSGPSEAGPGETVSVRTARGNIYAKMTIVNRGPGAAEVAIESWNYSGSVTVAAGDSVTLTEIFGDRWTRVTNRSGAATISIVTALSSSASKGAK